MGVSFEESLARGRIGENAVVGWLRGRGNGVISVYEIEHRNGKGPRYLAPHGRDLVAPDILVFNGKNVIWAETKTKARFSWYRIGRRWVTGIDLRHLEEYTRVADQTNLPVWLLFLHEVSTPSASDRLHGCPETCPVGLFAGELTALLKCESHRSQNHGRSGMVYWARENLRLLEGQALNARPIS